MMHAKTTTGAPRAGVTLLAGLVRCRHCGRKMQVRYNKNQAQAQTYHYYLCSVPHVFSDRAAPQTFSFNGQKLEHLVAAEILQVVQPQAIQAALMAADIYHQRGQAQLGALTNSLEQAQYEARRLERQYNAVEPENRLVAATLEQRWQHALAHVQALQEEYATVKAQYPELTVAQREQLFRLAQELPRLWQDPRCDHREKTRLVRLLITEIWVERVTPTQMKAVIHWVGGVHTTVAFSRQVHAQKSAPAAVTVSITPDILRQLAQTCDDEQIVRIHNRAHYRSESSTLPGRWTKAQVAQLRQDYQIPAFSQEAYRQLAVVNLQEAAELLEVSLATVYQLIKRQLLEAHQVLKYAPWQIKKSQLAQPAVLRYLQNLRPGKQKTINKQQLTLI